MGSKNNKRKPVPLDEKIEIFKDFLKQPEDQREPLRGSTIFKGYPIGHWAIQIRSQAKNIGKAKRNYKISEEQLKKLEALGILEKQTNNITIDEKIAELIKWNQEYPQFCPARNTPLLAPLPNELSDRFNKMCENYDYVVKRQKNFKVLTPEQFNACKEGNVRGYFGYPTKIEEIAHKYMQTPDMIDSSLIDPENSRYKTIDKFIIHEIETVNLGLLRQFYEVNLRGHKGFELLLREIFGDKTLRYI